MQDSVNRLSLCPTWLSFITFALVACSSSGGSTSSEPGAAAVAQADTPTLLTSLSVSPLTMSPAFSADVHDYIVPCAAGDNPLSLSLGAAAGVALTVIEPTTTVTGADGMSASMTLAEDDPLIIEAASGGVKQAYWLRCLPHDFPAVSFTSHPTAGTRTPGWYLMGNVYISTGESGFAMILDDQGTPVWYQRVSTVTGAMDIAWQPNGTLTYVETIGPYGDDPGASQVMQKLDPWTTREIQSVDTPVDEHELQVLANGDVLLFTYASLGGVDLTGLATFGAGSTIADCTIQELDPTGALVWSWRAVDHIDPVKESVAPLNNTIDGVFVVDPFHLNSIAVDSLGNLLVSGRALSAVMYIEKSSGTILWKMGGTAYSKDGAQLLAVAGDPETTFDSQHDARFQPNGDVSLFDDHSDLPGFARGVEYALDLTAGTATFVTQFANPTPVVSEAMGSFRRYPDGSNLVSWGLSPSSPADITEFDSSGADVLDIAFVNATDSSYRAVKVPTDTFDANVLRATAGHP